MPLYTKKKFAQLCGKTPAHVSTNISRGKIIVSGDHIDSDIPENFELMNKWRVQSGLEEIKPITPETTKTSPKTPENPKKTENSSQTTNKSAVSRLNREKTIAEIEYKREKAHETRLKNAKLRGELIPTNMVVDLFAMLGHQFQMQYETGANEMVLEMAHKMKLSPEMRGEIGEKLVELINKSHKKAVEEAQNMVKSIIAGVSGHETDENNDHDSEDE